MHFAIYACVIAYLLLVRVLRFRWVNKLPARLRMEQRCDYASMTADQAQNILQQLAELEFPRLYSLSILFALFKTYGIPSISSLLVKTKQLTSKSTMSKRTADTGILILEMCLNSPSSLRSRAALSRMNYLHSHYRQSGKITNDDMLYTLSLFALEPVRWIERFEWRTFTDLERCAQGTLWKAIGDAMDISYDMLPSHRQGWQHGLHWLNELEMWSDVYERKRMVPAQSNKELADTLINHLFLSCPTPLAPYVEKLFAVILGERVSKAMMLREPSHVFTSIVNGAIAVRKFCLRHFALPRPHLFRKQYINERVDPITGKYNAIDWLSDPWYVKPSFATRWGPEAWIKKLMGAKLPGDGGTRYAPDGYLVTQLGPSEQSRRGEEYMHEDGIRMEDIQFGGCPFHV